MIAVAAGDGGDAALGFTAEAPDGVAGGTNGT